MKIFSFVKNFIFRFDCYMLFVRKTFVMIILIFNNFIFNFFRDFFIFDVLK